MQQVLFSFANWLFDNGDERWQTSIVELIELIKVIPTDNAPLTIQQCQKIEMYMTAHFFNHSNQEYVSWQERWRKCQIEKQQKHQELQRLQQQQLQQQLQTTNVTEATSTFTRPSSSTASMPLTAVSPFHDDATALRETLPSPHLPLFVKTVKRRLPTMESDLSVVVTEPRDVDTDLLFAELSDVSHYAKNDIVELDENFYCGPSSDVDQSLHHAQNQDLAVYQQKILLLNFKNLARKSLMVIKEYCARQDLTPSFSDCMSREQIALFVSHLHRAAESHLVSLLRQTFVEHNNYSANAIQSTIVESSRDNNFIFL